MGMKVAAVFVALVAVRAVYGADIIVGGDSGWTQMFNYDNWASAQTFKVGDSLGNVTLTHTHTHLFIFQYEYKTNYQ